MTNTKTEARNLHEEPKYLALQVFLIVPESNKVLNK